MGQGLKRLVLPRGGIAIGRAAHGLLAGRGAVGQSLLPGFATHGVVGKPLELVPQISGVDLFESAHDAGVQGPAALM
jgi:hypothetical protein